MKHATQPVQGKIIPPPRPTLWVPLLISVALSGVFLGVLAFLHDP